MGLLVWTYLLQNHWKWKGSILVVLYSDQYVRLKKLHVSLQTQYSDKSLTLFIAKELVKVLFIAKELVKVTSLVNLQVLFPLKINGKN